MRGWWRFTPILAVTVLAVAAGAVGAGERPPVPRSAPVSPSTPARAVSPTTTVPPSTSTMVLPPPSGQVTPTTTVNPSAQGPPVARCTFAELAVSAGREGAAVGHWGVPLQFRNVATTTCALYGYPGVALLDAAGHVVGQAVRTPFGYLGGLRTGSSSPPTAILAPGQTGTAVLEGSDVPTAGPLASCPRYRGILVTPPTSTHAVDIDLPVLGCSRVQVHPVVATTSSTTTPGSTRTWSEVTVTRLTSSG